MRRGHLSLIQPWSFYGIPSRLYWCCDKTQIATVAMAAHYSTPLLVVIVTTLGMLIADVPAVFVGDKLADRIPMRLIHSIAAGVFAVLGIATLLGAGSGFGF